MVFMYIVKPGLLFTEKVGKLFGPRGAIQIWIKTG
jgi:hypothetical protein